MRSTRLASLATVLSLVIACGGGGGSPTSPTAGAQGAIVANVSISGFTVTPSIVGSGRSYLVSFTMTETSGRASATVTTIRFGVGSGNANADPTPPIRLAAGASASSGNININDSTGATASITTISVSVGFADDSGRSGNTTGSASFTQPSAPPPAPVARTFTVAGVVLDRSGRAIRDATVTATDSTNVARTGSTDGNGYFSIAPLREGEVRTSVTASGFQSSSRTVTLTSDTRLDWTLVENPTPPTPPPASASCPTPPYRWDDNPNVQRCRAPNGQFAPSACCGR